MLSAVHKVTLLQSVVILESTGSIIKQFNTEKTLISSVARRKLGQHLQYISYGTVSSNFQIFLTYQTKDLHYSQLHLWLELMMDKHIKHTAFVTLCSWCRL